MHDELWANCLKPGKLTLKTKLNLHDMLRPAVQPGSKIDYEWPVEHVTVTLRASGDGDSPAMAVKGPKGPLAIEKSKGQGLPFIARLTVTPEVDAPVPVEVTLTTGEKPAFELGWTTQEDDRPRALQLQRLLLPWAVMKKLEPPLARDIP
jgi:hypothetical protein